jgi:hypothetical protein
LGEVRQVVLQHLGNRYGHCFAYHGEFVRFAQEQHLDLDFTTPPTGFARSHRPPPDPLARWEAAVLDQWAANLLAE